MGQKEYLHVILVLHLTEAKKAMGARINIREVKHL